MSALEVLQDLIRREWPVRVLSPVLGKYNPFRPDFPLDPYPAYRRLRETAPVYRSRAFQSLILSRYGDVAPMLQDGRLGVDRTKSRIAQRMGMFDAMRPDLRDAVTQSLLMLDAPDHTRLRRLVSKAFTPRVVQRLDERVQELVAEIQGRRVKKGHLVGLLLAAANRDPMRFPDPERLDFGRADNPHLAFGHGVHFCLGAQLARLEGRVAITGLLRRFPDLDGERHPKTWKRSLVLRGLTSLPLQLNAARSAPAPAAAG